MDWPLAFLAAASAAGNTPLASEMNLRDRWVAQAFLGEPAPPLPDGPGLIVQRQEWGTFRLNRSVAESPLRIGQRGFARGLGTHATSEILVRLPGPAQRLEAAIGVDNCPFTGGQGGSVTFAVAAAGQERFRSPVMRGSDPAQGLRVPLDGATDLTLLVEDGGDGPACDVSDWGEARVTLTDGTVVWLDELPVLRSPSEPSADLPFSFTYGGRPSADLLPGWERKVTTEAQGDATLHRVSYRDLASGLLVTCTAKAFADFPAVDWLLEFENTGAADSEVLGAVLPLDLLVSLPPGEFTHLRHSHGSTCEFTDFIPVDEPLKPEQEIALAPGGGRSSNGVLPFLNVDWTTGGAIVAIGWSGQWAGRIARPEARSLRLEAGMERCRLRLHPGENIRTPRILTLWWQGEDRQRAHNLFRRLMLAHYVPRVDGQPAVPPVAHPTAASILLSGQTANETNQLEMLHAAADLGVEAFWLDAYWFPAGFPGGVGTWEPRPEDFPRGLRPLGDAAHAAGMRFILWFEPERVAASSRIATEHPEFCLRVGDGDRLLNLGDPAAREFMTDLLSDAIAEYGLDIYREDFNIDPLPFWRAADEPEREGMTEIRFVEGLYAMWSELRRRYPHLAIDNCASGGRRIDLETCSLAYPLWRSDMQDTGIYDTARRRLLPTAGQAETAGLSLYLPFHTCGVWGFDPYTFRSSMTTGAACYCDLRAPDLDRDQARHAIAELKALRPCFMGDYYPLTDINTDERAWCAYQFDRPDLGEGMALFFRRSASPYFGLEASLQAINRDATYEVALCPDYSEPQWQRMTGADLIHLRISIPEAPGCMLLRYRAAP